MADLTEQQSAQTVKVTGANSTGVENNYLDIDSSGRVTVNQGVAGATNWLTNIAAFGGSAVALGQALMASSIPVVLSSNQTAIPITDNSGSLTVDNNGTFAVQAAQSGAWTVTANAGTNLNTSALALDANLIKLTITQGASLGSNTQVLVGGSVTTAAPTYTTGQISPFSLNTSGALRVDVTTVPANQSVNVAQYGGNTVVTGGVNGSVGVGGLASSGAAVSGNPVLIGGSDGTNARTILTDSSGVQYVRARDRATFTAIASATALGNGKSMVSLQNTTGSAVLLRIWKIFIINTQTAANTGVTAEFQLRRFTSHSAGTLITPNSHDSADSLDGSITVRTGATLTGEASAFIDRRLWSSDDWGPGTLDTEANDHAAQSVNPQWDFDGMSVARPFVLRANEGLTVRCNTNSTSGTFDVVVVFTQE